MNMIEIKPVRVLIISPHQFLKTLVDTLIDENIVGASDYKLTISSCESVEDVVCFRQLSEETHEKYLFDFVVLVVDVVLGYGLQKVENEISLIPNYYLTTRRLFFVSSNSLNLDSGFYKLQNKYKCLSVIGDISEPKSCASIARRILKLIEFCGGMETGLPFIGIE